MAHPEQQAQQPVPQTAAVAPAAAPAAPAPPAEPQPQAAADEQKPPSLVELYEEILDRVRRAQDRIKGKNDAFVRKAQKVGVPVAVRDVLHDEAFELLAISLKLGADHADFFEQLEDRLEEQGQALEEQGRLLQAIMSGSALALSVALAQRVLEEGRKELDDDMRSIAQQILASVAAVQRYAPQPVPTQPPVPSEEGGTAVAALPPPEEAPPEGADGAQARDQASPADAAPPEAPAAAPEAPAAPAPTGPSESAPESAADSAVTAADPTSAPPPEADPAAENSSQDS